MAATACDARQMLNSLDTRLGLVGDSLRENYFMLGLSVVAVLVCLLLVWLIVSNIVSIIRTYLMFTRRHEPGLKVTATKDLPQDLVNATVEAQLMGRIGRSADDYGPYPSTAKADAEADPPSERDSVLAKVAELQSQYADYNKEIGKFSREVLRREPEDIMDRRILGKEDDVYAS